MHFVFGIFFKFHIKLVHIYIIGINFVSYNSSYTSKNTIMLKKILKCTGIFLLVNIIALAAAPFLFKDKIKEMIAKTLNENVNANIAFEDVDLSLFKSFPQAYVTIDKLSSINKAPFAGDTLLYAGET